MEILIKGKRGEGKSTIALIPYRALVKRNYNVHSKVEGVIDLERMSLEKADITLIEVFPTD